MGFKRAKIAIIGAGQVGATAAQRVAERELGDVVLVDIIEGMPQGKALDLQEAAPLEHHDAKLSGSNDYAALAGADIVVVTAGLARKPGMSREDLLAKNAEIVGAAATQIKKYAAQSIVIVVSNPLDVMTYLVWKMTGFPKQRVLGMAGVLDSARFRTFIAEAVGVSVQDVQAMVLGGHGDSMVPVKSFASVSGIPAQTLIEQGAFERLIERTRNGGAEIVALLKQGSAFYAPASSVADMVESIVRDQRRLMPVCARCEGEFGLQDVFCGVPVILGGNGIEKIVEVSLAPDEKKALTASAEEVRKNCAALKV